ncbi:MAG: hypothetical protein HY433_00840 [Candidatus Liptonbacteria bacterium]|nr:hypothetical protein [Candidatus Liptonbacteria bacterium]
MNKRIFAATATFIIFLSPLFASAAGPKFIYAGWLPFWKKQSGALDIALNLGKLNEISPFSYEVNPDGTLRDVLKINDGFWPGWLAAARDLNVKILPTVALFDGKAIHKLFSNKKLRIAHEDAIAKLVKDKNFDGIDIDYEGKLAETKPYFSLFVEGLALRLHPKKKLLSCTIEARTPLTSRLGGVPKDTRTANDYIVLNKYCDEVRIMAYDQGLIDGLLDRKKGNGTLYAPVADPDWAEKTVREALKYINPKKIMLGIPTYGYEYQVSWRDGFLEYERLRSHTFFQAMNRAEAVGAAPARNSAGEMSFAYTTSTFVNDVSSGLTWFVSSTLPASIAFSNTSTSVARFVSFSDAESAAQKIALAKKLGLRGVVFFKFDGEQDPLLWGKMK